MSAFRLYLHCSSALMFGWCLNDEFVLTISKVTIYVIQICFAFYFLVISSLFYVFCLVCYYSHHLAVVFHSHLPPLTYWPYYCLLNVGCSSYTHIFDILPFSFVFFSVMNVFTLSECSFFFNLPLRVRRKKWHRRIYHIFSDENESEWVPWCIWIVIIERLVFSSDIYRLPISELCILSGLWPFLVLLAYYISWLGMVRLQSYIFLFFFFLFFGVCVIAFPNQNKQESFFVTATQSRW